MASTLNDAHRAMGLFSLAHLEPLAGLVTRRTQRSVNDSGGLGGMVDNPLMGTSEPSKSPADTVAKPVELTAFDPNQTISYQSRITRAPGWFGSFLASNSREKNRMRIELSKIKGAIPLLMKPRNGSKWTEQDLQEIKLMLRAASAVYPYLIIWALPGSILLLPFLAWHLDARRKNRESKAAAGPSA